LPQASVAIKILVCERKHPLLLIVPVETVTVGVPHASLAFALPNAASMAAEVGLHPSVGDEPVATMAGVVVLVDQLTVLDTEAVLPQISVAVHVLVCD